MSLSIERLEECLAAADAEITRLTAEVTAYDLRMENDKAEIERLKAALNKYSEDEILLRKDAALRRARG